MKGCAAVEKASMTEWCPYHHPEVDYFSIKAHLDRFYYFWSTANDEFYLIQHDTWNFSTLLWL